METCHCGQNTSLEKCCLPIINGEKEASNPEELMRSRYTAFCLKDMDYIYASTDPQRQSDFDFEENKNWASSVEFTGLKIVKSSEEGNKGVVEFIAHFKVQGAEEVQVHHELSKFRKVDGIWYFREGKILKE